MSSRSFFRGHYLFNIFKNRTEYFVNDNKAYGQIQQKYEFKFKAYLSLCIKSSGFYERELFYVK